MNHDGIEADRERAAFAAWVDETESSGESLDAGKIWEAVAGELSAEETGRLLDRAGESAEIAQAWRLARELQAEAAEHVTGENDQGSRSVWGKSAYWLGLAATVLLAIGLWPGLWDRSAPHPPVYRSTTGQDLVSRVEEGIALPRDRFLLRWSPAEGQGWHYELRLSTRDLEELARARYLDQPEYLVPPEVLDVCRNGSRLYWRIEAKNEDGRRITSPTFIVSVR